MKYYRMYKVYDENLSFEINLILSVFRGYKSFARKEGFLEDYATFYSLDKYGLEDSIYTNATQQAIAIGLLKQSKNKSLRLDEKGYKKVGSFFGAEAKALRQMRNDAFQERREAWSSSFGNR